MSEISPTQAVKKPPLPWYKNYILILMIFLPLFSVAGSIATLVLAIKSDESAVMQGYYKDGLAPRQLVASAKSQRIRAEIAQGILTLQGSEEPVLLLKLEHPTLDTKDQSYEIARNAAGQYPLNPAILQHLQMQRWYVQVSDKALTWRISGEAHGQVNGQKLPISLDAN